MPRFAEFFAGIGLVREAIEPLGWECVREPKVTAGDELEQALERQRERLSRLSGASLRINESLDFETVLREVLESARSLTDAAYGMITLIDEAGEVEVDAVLSSGLSPDENQQLWNWPEAHKLVEYLGATRVPLRLADLGSHTAALGLPELRLPMPVSASLAFLAAPLQNGGVTVGHFFLAKKEGGGEFSQDDEEILVLFASQAAMVIANARRRRDEQRAQKDLQTLIDTCPVGIVVFDARTGEPVSSNREAARIVGVLSPPDGESLNQLLETMTVRRADGREFSLGEYPMARALSIGETVRAEEIVLQVPDGRSITTLINATPIYTDDGTEPESVVVTLQDMTLVGELERLRAEFLAMVSHELLAPLISIKGSTATLLQAASDLDPAEMLQFHRIIDEQSDYMRDLIGDLLDIARIKTGEFSVAPEPVEVVRLLDEARVRSLSGDVRNEVGIDLSPNLPMVMADRRRIVQVLTNLLTNALRYSQDPFVIRVSAVLEDTHVAISVTDEGAGLTAAALPHVFGRFSRSEQSESSPHREGAGLGLAISKGIVEAHGGRIWAESEGPGRGARFTFTLPVAEGVGGGVAAPSGTSSTTRPAAGERVRVLVVDDDPQMLRYLRVTLSQAGYASSVTGDPQDVLRLLEEQEPNLILLDLMLPGTDGITLMEDILAKVDVPVILLSAYRQDEVIARAFDMGAVDYVVKPFSTTELMARVKAALRRRATPEETPPFVLGPLRVDFADRAVTVAGRPVPLTALEHRLLAELCVKAGRLVTYEHLMQRVWRTENVDDLRPMRTVVRNLRQKLGDDAANPTYIFNESRMGYRMRAPGKGTG